MTIFRPCIDLHNGQVKQIVGSTLTDKKDSLSTDSLSTDSLSTNFISDKPPAFFSQLYKKDSARGGHVIMLGSGNEKAAKEALHAYSNGMHIGGGITPDNAKKWIDEGAEKIIVTSYLFTDNSLDIQKVKKMSETVGSGRLVIDLSCKRTSAGWNVATNRWQTVTQTPVDKKTLETLAHYCSEFLIHAADVEGLCQGIDKDLVEMLGKNSPILCTYAGGAKSINDLQLVSDLSSGRVDLTYGSALDIFGGVLVRYSECIKWNKQHL